MRYSEDQLEGVLNLPVADIARGLGKPEAGISQRAVFASRNPAGRATVHAILDDAAIYVKTRVGIAEHRVIEQVEELQAELKPGFLPEHLGAMERQVPVLKDREINVGNSRATATARPGIGVTSGLETVPCKGLRVKPLSPVPT